MISGAELSLDRLVALGSFAIPGAPNGLAQGRVAGISGRRRGEGCDLFDLRPFVDGDDPRMMDPGTSARSGRPQLRRRHEEIERSLQLVVDMRAPMLWGTKGRFRSVAAAEAAVSEGWRCVLGGGRCGLTILRDEGFEWVPARLREAAMLEIAASLVQAHAQALVAKPGTYSTLVDMLPEVAARSSSGTSIVLATGLDAPGDGFELMVTAIARRNPLEVFLVQDAVEIEPPSVPVHARIGKRLVRGRFRRGSAVQMLSDHGIDFRVIRSDQIGDLPL